MDRLSPHRCTKCGSRLATPQVEPDLKPYRVRYHFPEVGSIVVVVYAVSAKHAKEMAPQVEYLSQVGVVRDALPYGGV